MADTVCSGNSDFMLVPHDTAVCFWTLGTTSACYHSVYKHKRLIYTLFSQSQEKSFKKCRIPWSPGGKIDEGSVADDRFRPKIAPRIHCRLEHGRQFRTSIPAVVMKIVPGRAVGRLCTSFADLLIAFTIQHLGLSVSGFVSG
jgi:hypothetical protein